MANINHKPDLVSLLRRAEPFWLSRVEEPEVSLKTQAVRFTLKRNQPLRAFQLYTLFNTLFATVETEQGNQRRIQHFLKTEYGAAMKTPPVQQAKAHRSHSKVDKCFWTRGERNEPSAFLINEMIHPHINTTEENFYSASQRQL